jgi:hypothetical protein
MKVVLGDYKGHVTRPEAPSFHLDAWPRTLLTAFSAHLAGGPHHQRAARPDAQQQWQGQLGICDLPVPDGGSRPSRRIDRPRCRRRLAGIGRRRCGPPAAACDGGKADGRVWARARGGCDQSRRGVTNGRGEKAATGPVGGERSADVEQSLRSRSATKVLKSAFSCRPTSRPSALRARVLWSQREGRSGIGKLPGPASKCCSDDAGCRRQHQVLSLARLAFRARRVAAAACPGGRH